MKPSIRINFAAFWPGFHPEHFRRFFPYVFDKYDLIMSQDPEVVFYSVYSKQFVPYANPRTNPPITRIAPGKFVRVLSEPAGKFARLLTAYNDQRKDT